MEIWKDIKGYEGYYQVSNLGSVKSLNRNVKSTKKYQTFYKSINERILKTDIKKGFCPLLPTPCYKPFLLVFTI